MTEKTEESIFFLSGNSGHKDAKGSKRQYSNQWGTSSLTLESFKDQIIGTLKDLGASRYSSFK